MDLFEPGEPSRTPSASSESSSSSATDPILAAAYDTAYEISNAFFQAFKSVDWNTTKLLLNLQQLSLELSACTLGMASHMSALMTRIASAKAHVDNLLLQQAGSDHPGASGYTMEPALGFPAQCMLLASSIYINLFLLRLPPENSRFAWIVDLFIQNYEAGEAIIGEFYPPERAFWILYVSGCAATGRNQRLWVLHQLYEVRCSLQLVNWSDAENVLEKTAWIKRPESQRDRALWEEVEFT